MRRHEHRLLEAYSSMVSDLGKHPETLDHAGIPLGLALFVAGQLGSQSAMHRFIAGFN